MTDARDDFNPRTHEGCDTSPDLQMSLATFYFNPRTHEGCDSRSGIQSVVTTLISIHAPTRGATK